MKQTTLEIEKEGKLLRYLTNASPRTLQSFEMQKLSEKASLKRDLAELIDKLAEAEAEARIANLIGNYLRDET